jgi:Glycosyl transferases group 1
MPASLRSNLRRLLLRGPVHDRWAARRGRQIDAAYCAQLVGTLSAPNAPVAAHVSTAPSALRQILLIADCMWEQNDLVPELARIAETRTLDLHPLLATASHQQSPASVVTKAVSDFAANETKWSPDVILFYARPNLLSEEVFHVLRRRWQCPLLGMNLDEKLQFFPYGILADQNDNYQLWARKFDLNITNCLAATDWYRARGCPVIYSPQGVRQPPDLTPPASGDFQYDFSFLGTIKLERVAVIRELQRRGLSIRLFGAGWPNSQWVDNANAVFRASQINLGIGFATPSFALTTIKGRDFECPGVGACYLTTYNWELMFHWELGKEILCYRSMEELVEMYAYYHKRPAECLKIAQAAWRRSVAEHTWEKRFRKIFRQTGFKV